MNNDPLDAVALPNIRECRNAIAKYIVQTPVVRWRGEGARALEAQGTEAWFKLELFQRTGTFKARGALNNVLHLTDDQRHKGITAVSAGNHAVAAAFAAREIGTSAKVVMIKTANAARVARAKEYGAEIVFAEDGASAFRMVDEISKSEGRTLVHPFEGPLTAQGTGTVGLEFAEQVPDMSAVVIAIGGGGLCGGAAAAIKQINPQCEVYGVEPEGADVMRRSFAQGSPATMPSINTIADSLAPPMTLPFAFAACRRYVDDLVTINDDEMRGAMRILFDDLKIVVEPAGSAATAAVLGVLQDRLRDKRVGILICGSLIDPATFHEQIASPLQ